MPFFRGSSLAQLVLNVMVVSYASAIITAGVTCLLIYVLQQLGAA